MNPELDDDTIVDAEIIEDAPGTELALTDRTVEVIPAGLPVNRGHYDRLTVILPPPLTPAETLTAFVPLPKFNWHKWIFDVGDAVHDGDRDAVQTLLDLGMRKGFA